MGIVGLCKQKINKPRCYMLEAQEKHKISCIKMKGKDQCKISDWSSTLSNHPQVETRQSFMPEPFVKWIIFDLSGFCRTIIFTHSKGRDGKGVMHFGETSHLNASEKTVTAWSHKQGRLHSRLCVWNQHTKPAIA